MRGRHFSALYDTHVHCCFSLVFLPSNPSPAHFHLCALACECPSAPDLEIMSHGPTLCLPQEAVCHKASCSSASSWSLPAASLAPSCNCLQCHHIIHICSNPCMLALCLTSACLSVSQNILPSPLPPTHLLRIGLAEHFCNQSKCKRTLLPLLAGVPATLLRNSAPGVPMGWKRT